MTSTNNWIAALGKSWPLKLLGKTNHQKAVSSTSEPDRAGEAAQDFSAHAASTAPAAKKILVVDDDAVVRKATSIKLEAGGYITIAVADASEAIAAARDQQPQVILLDVDFPPDVSHGGAHCWDGFKLMLWLRNATNLPPKHFIFMTGSAPPEFEQRAMATGIAAVFRKPVDYPRLLELIDKLLREPALTEASECASPAGR